MNYSTFIGMVKFSEVGFWTAVLVNFKEPTDFWEAQKAFQEWGTQMGYTTDLLRIPEVIEL
jgi:hypothetical protein